MENKLKNNLDLRKVLIILLAVSFVVLTVLDLSLNLNKKTKMDIGAVISKLAKTMTYAEVKEETEERTQKLITGMVCLGDYSYGSSKIIAMGINMNNYSKANNVILSGTYVEECILGKRRRNINNKVHR